MFVRRSRLKPQINLNCQRRREDQKPSSPAKKPDTRSASNAKKPSVVTQTNVNESKSSKPPEVKKDAAPKKLANEDVPKTPPASPQGTSDVKQDIPKVIVPSNEEKSPQENVSGNNESSLNKKAEETILGDKSEVPENPLVESIKEPAKINDQSSSESPFKVPMKVVEKSFKVNDVNSVANDVIQKDLKSYFDKIQVTLNEKAQLKALQDSGKKIPSPKDSGTQIKTAPSRERTLSGGKRIPKRARTESSSSMFSDSYSSYSANKLRKMDEQRRLQRAESKKSIAAGVTDKANLKMFDLLYYNPPGTPMQITTETKQPVPKSYGLEDEIDSDYQESADSVNLAPQLKLGANGEMIVDHSSLQIETTVDPEAAKSLKNSSAIVHDEDTGMSGFYNRKPKSKYWPNEETVRFYRCLQVIGTDFSCMTQLFPNRTRRDLKLKFKKEERSNPHLINKAIMNPKQFNIKQLEEQLAESDEHLKIKKEKIIKKPPQVKEKVGKKRYESPVMRAMQNGDLVYLRHEGARFKGYTVPEENINAKENNNSKNLTVNNYNNNINNNIEQIMSEISNEENCENDAMGNDFVNRDNISMILNDKDIENSFGKNEQCNKVNNNEKKSTNKNKTKRKTKNNKNNKTENDGDNDNCSKKKRKQRAKKNTSEEKSDGSLNSIKVEPDYDNGEIIAKKEPRGERTVSGDSFNLEQIEDELRTLLNSNDDLLDQVELDSLTDAEKALLSNPNTPKKHYRDFIQKNLINSYNKSPGKSNNIPLPSIDSIMDRLNENKLGLSGMFNGKTEPISHDTSNDRDSVTSSGDYYDSVGNHHDQMEFLPNSQDTLEENNYAGVPEPDNFNRDLSAFSAMDSPCPSSSSCSNEPPAVTKFKQEQIVIEDSDNENESDCEVDVNEIQTILERIIDGSMVFVSTLDPKDSDHVINEIFYRNKDTGDLSTNPLQLSEEVVQAILEVIT